MKLRSCMHIGPFCLQDIIVFQGTTLLPWPLGIMVAVPTGFYCGFKGNECQSSHFLEMPSFVEKKESYCYLGPLFYECADTHWAKIFKDANVGKKVFIFCPRVGKYTHIKESHISYDMVFQSPFQSPMGGVISSVFHLSFSLGYKKQTRQFQYFYYLYIHS